MECDRRLGPDRDLEEAQGASLDYFNLKELKAGTPRIYDEGKVSVEAFQELGDGTIDFAKVIKVSAEIGVEQCHVEQDKSPDPIASMGQSLEHFKTL